MLHADNEVNFIGKEWFVDWARNLYYGIFLMEYDSTVQLGLIAT